MKKHICTFICLLSLVMLKAQPVYVDGIENFEKQTNPIPIKLFKVVNGQCSEISSATPASDGKFGFLFYPLYEGLYTMGIGNAASPNNNFTFYFKPGDHLSVEFTGWDYKLTGKDNSKENVVLYQWHQLTDTIYQKAINFSHGISTYVDFFPQLEETAGKTKGWFDNKHTGNTIFDMLMPHYMQLDMAMMAMNFLQTPRTAHPSVEEYSPYYGSIKTVDFTQTTEWIYKYPWGLRTMQALAYKDCSVSGKDFKKGFDLVEAFSPYIVNDTLKGDVVLSKAITLKDYGNYKDLTDKYGKYILTDSQKVKLVNIAAPLMKYKEGDDAYNFSYEDNHGKTVSLTDLNGKLVYVDVWATWCGPCKAEIPYLKNIEEEMKDKDIQFVSISVDNPSDKQKWLTFIDTAHLGGTQLFAGGWSQNGGLAGYYKITGIPRFMLFDKNGKIINVDAPRPSNSELKELLESKLKSN